MRTRVQKWGNSLAIRIPRSAAGEAKIEEGTSVDVAVVDGSLVVSRSEEAPSLAELLAAITDENIHAEIDSGPPVGREVW